MFGTSLKQLLPQAFSFSGWPLLLIVTAGASVGGTVWWVVQSQHSWLEVTKGKDGEIVELHVAPQQIPQAVVAQLPAPDDNTPLRDPARIKALAEKCGLYQSWKANSHLRFDGGDISYWSELGRPAWELEIQFLSRRLVLEAAERAQAHIATPGDLSSWAERLHPVLFKNAQEK